MDNWLKNPWAIRLISLILAILLYTAVSISQDPGSEDRTFTPSGTEQSERITGVPVEILMDENDYVVSGVPDTVIVGVEGPQSAITPIVRQESVDVFVDLREYGPGTYEVDLQYSGIPDNVNAYVEPRTVEVTIEERATAEFNVEVDYINASQIVNGYEVGEATVNPETITVVSSQSEVNKVAAVKAYVDLSGVEAPIDSREVPINVYDSQGNELNVTVEPETVSVSVEILNPNKEVSIEAATTGEVPDGFVVESISVEPENATVFASEGTLGDISEIMTEEIDLSQVTETTQMDVSLDVPSGVRRVEPEQVQVTIQLNQAEASTFENVEVETRNLPDNRSVSFVEPDTGAMNVTVLGTEEELSDLTEENIQLSVNLSDVNMGEQEVEVVAEVPGDLVTELEYEQATLMVE